MKIQLSLHKRLIMAFIAMSILVILASASALFFSRTANHYFPGNTIGI